MEFLRRRFGLILRAVISTLAICWVVRTNDWGQVWSNVLTMDVRWLLAGVLCFVPTLLIISWRWRLLLGEQGVHLRFWRVLELNMIGQFFSTIGVGTTGGDVFKIFYVARAVPQQKAAVAFAVIIDRVIGLMALLLFGTAFACGRLPLLFSRSDTGKLTSTFFVFAVVGAVASIVATLGPFLLEIGFFRSWLKGLRGTTIFAAYECAARALGTNVLALVGSIPSHLSITLMGYCVLRAMNIHPDMIAFAAILAMMNLLISLPVSISGIGLRETFFPVFFVLLNVDKGHAVAFALTFFALNIFWCLMGGPFYFLYRHETHTPPPNVGEVEPIFSQR